MSSKSTQSLALILAVFFAPAVSAFAATAQKGSKPANSVTVTGCLQKGDEAGEFAITGENGKNYELVSRSVKLSEHAGHKVSVTGTLIGEEKEENQKKEEGEGWSGKIRVSSLKMVSETCK